MPSRETPLRVSAVLWDFDDTLVDSLPTRVQALSQVFRDADIAGVDVRHFLHTLEDRTLEESLVSLATSQGKPADLYRRYRNIYWTKDPAVLRLFPGMDEVLEALARHGVSMAVVTQKARSFEIQGVAAGASVELEALGIADLFPVVIGIEDVTKTKPHPEGILKALERLGASPERALMVGDTVADIGAAKAAGCWSCLATWGVPDGADRARRTRPDFVAEAPLDLLSLLGFADGPRQA
ncbi:MAG: HAD-IA family hydrolase [Chloroflexota bacterium]|nr:HAD-IA family hydrolase [Chloroflexota bacterium]MDE2970291.1 HAD-IA family hydrolase [Chloroflexota bacterium]